MNPLWARHWVSSAEVLFFCTKIFTYCIFQGLLKHWGDRTAAQRLGCGVAAPPGGQLELSLPPAIRSAPAPGSKQLGDGLTPASAQGGPPERPGLPGPWGSPSRKTLKVTGYVLETKTPSLFLVCKMGTSHSWLLRKRLTILGLPNSNLHTGRAPPPFFLVYSSVNFDNHISTFNPLQSGRGASTTPEVTLWCPFTDNPLSTPAPDTSDLFAIVLPFLLRMSQKWTHTVWSLLKLASFT